MTKVTDLIERLRKRDADWQASCDGWLAQVDISVAEESGPIIRDTIYRQAADRIETLSSECEALRKALQTFERCAYPVDTSIDPRGHGWMPEKTLDYALSVARTTLQETNGGGNADVS